MSTPIKSTEPCPTCLLQNRQYNAIQNRQGSYEAFCAAGHRFPDTDDLNTLRRQARTQYPQFYKGAQPKPPDPTEFDRDIVIDRETKGLIEELSGVTFTSAAELKGFVYHLAEDNKSKDAELKSLRATVTSLSRRVNSIGKNGSGPAAADDQILITIPEWAYAGVESQAGHDQKTVEEWVKDEIGNWFEGYFSGQMGPRR